MLDSTFSGDGMVTMTVFGTSNIIREFATDVAIQGDGKVVVVGFAFGESTSGSSRLSGSTPTVGSTAG